MTFRLMALGLALILGMAGCKDPNAKNGQAATGVAIEQKPWIGTWFVRIGLAS